VAAPLLLVAEPVLLTLVLLEVDVLAALEPPLVAPPVVVVPPLLPVTDVWVVAPVALALPLEPLAPVLVLDVDEDELLAVVSARAA
jgi:hypothetical protein